MKVDLAELLRLRPIVHPTQIVSTAIAQKTLRIIVRGYPWWLSAPGPVEEDNIDFLFEGVGRGILRTEDFCGDEPNFYESLDDFDIQFLDDVLWAQPNAFSIFCSSPLRSPVALYIAVHDFLKNVESYRGPEDFLNYPSGQISQFIETTSTSSFLVARGPECIRQIVCEQLKEQGVMYNIVEASPAPTGGFLVTLQDSHFFCTGAFAEFDSG